MTVANGGQPQRGAETSERTGTRRPRRRTKAQADAVARAEDAAGLHAPVPRSFPSAPPADAFGVRDLYSIVGRHIPLIAFATVACLALGAAYLMLSPARYVATATVLINPPEQQLGAADAVSSGFDEYRIEGQTQILRSDAVARTVVESLGLVDAGIEQDDNVFLLHQIRTAREAVARFIPALARDSANDDPVQAAIQTIRRNLTISRAAMTQVISVAYDSTDPQRASAVVNGLIEAYGAERRRQDTEAAQRSVEWLAARLGELRGRFETADREVEDFKTANGIMGAGNNQHLLAEQRLYELTSQVDAARAAVEEARARYDTIRRIEQDGVTEFDLGQGGGADADAYLSGSSPEGARLLAELRPNAGADGSSIGAGLYDPNGRLAEEIARREETYRSELDAAVARQAMLEEALDKAVDESKQLSRNRIRLRELEATAESSRALHASTLQRYDNAVQQSLLPASDGMQVLIAARTPNGKSHPRPLLVFAFAGAFGLTFGVGAALARERLTSGFEAVWQVDPALGIGAIGALPKVRRLWRRTRASEQDRVCAGPPASGRAVLESPRSAFAETIRAIRLAIDQRQKGRHPCIVGVISATQAEGRGTVCTNLAQVIGKTGDSVLVIDADIVDARLTRMLTGTSPAGLADVMAGDAKLDDVIWRDDLSGGWFLPAGSGRDPAVERCLVASAKMKAFIATAAERFDYVILRLPPMASTADAAAAADWVDAFVLVVEWRRTPRDVVADAMAMSRSLQGKTVGAVLNKVSSSSLRQTGSYQGRRIYYSYP